MREDGDTRRAPVDPESRAQAMRVAAESLPMALHLWGAAVARLAAHEVAVMEDRQPREEEGAISNDLWDLSAILARHLKG